MNASFLWINSSTFVTAFNARYRIYRTVCSRSILPTHCAPPGPESLLVSAQQPAAS